MLVLDAGDNQTLHISAFGMDLVQFRLVRLIVEGLTEGDFTEGSVIPEKRRLRYDAFREICKPVDPEKGTPAV